MVATFYDILSRRTCGRNVVVAMKHFCKHQIIYKAISDWYLIILP